MHVRVVALGAILTVACTDKISDPSSTETEDITMSEPDSGSDDGGPTTQPDAGTDSGPTGEPDAGDEADSGSTDCTDGYVLTDGVCVDVDECMVDNGGCGAVGRATCLDNEGAPPTCADINECDVENGGCGDPTSYKCVNKDRLPPECMDLNACATDNGGCGDPAFNKCAIGSDGTVACSDINECLTDNGGCGDPAAVTCVNPANAKNSCADVDECANATLNDCPADKPCINVQGSYFCGCEYPTIYEPTAGNCRAARVLVLDDDGGTTLVEDLLDEGFAAIDGGLYYEWNQSPDISSFDTVLWLEGKEGNYGKQMLPGMDQQLAAFVAAGGGLIRTEWGLWYAAVQRTLGNPAINPASAAVMPVGLPAVVRYKNAGTSWTVTDTTSPLTRSLPETIATTGGYTLVEQLPGSRAVATTLDSRVINGVTVQTIVPVLSYTTVHGGITVHVNDTLLYNNGTRTTLPDEIKQVYFNAVHFSAQKVQN